MIEKSRVQPPPEGRALQRAATAEGMDTEEAFQTFRDLKLPLCQSVAEEVMARREAGP
jgi:hypothetical protein